MNRLRKHHRHNCRLICFGVLLLAGLCAADLTAQQLTVENLLRNSVDQVGPQHKDVSMAIEAFRAGKLLEARNLLESAPEQAEVGGVDPRTDVYSLGIVLYQLLTGRLPYEQQGIVEVLMEKARSAPRSPRSVNSRVPRVLDEICMRAVQPRMEDRFDSAHDMAKALLNYQTDEQGPGSGFFKRLFGRFGN